MSNAAAHEVTSDQPAAPLGVVVLDVCRIHPYEHNPRRAPNAEYGRIKASIRADGLGQPLVVTQRPGEADYIVHAGGNTRLRVLRELFDETGDRRFAEIPCVIRPWTREADVLLAHLKENDLRGALTFLDKSLAVADARRFFAKDTAEPLTQAGLAEVLRRHGYGLSQGLISQMAYAVERLVPLLPQALQGGIGRPQIAKIRSLDRAARAIWLERSVDTEAEYDLVFEALCRRYDTTDWDIASLRRALEAEIAERADISIHAVSLEIDARMSGRQLESPTRSMSFEDCEPDFNAGQRERGSADSKKPSETVRESGSVLASGGMIGTLPEPSTRVHPPAECVPDAEEETNPAAVSSPPPRVDLKSLRARLWTLASRIAQRNGLGDLVEPISGRGLGFVLQDVPDPALVDQLDEDALAQVSMVWWYLAACAELTVAPLDALLPALPEESVLRRALVDQDAGLLFASVWTLDPGQMGYRLWRRLDDRDWQDLLALMDTYRALRRTAAPDDKALWSRG